MLVLLFCVIRGRVLMSENPVNPVIHGPLWATKTKTALNDCKIKVDAREKTVVIIVNVHCTRCTSQCRLLQG